MITRFFTPLTSVAFGAVASLAGLTSARAQPINPLPSTYININSARPLQQGEGFMQYSSVSEMNNFSNASGELSPVKQFQIGTSLASWISVVGVVNRLGDAVVTDAENARYNFQLNPTLGGRLGDHAVLGVTTLISAGVNNTPGTQRNGSVSKGEVQVVPITQATFGGNGNHFTVGVAPFSFRDGNSRQAIMGGALNFGRLALVTSNILQFQYLADSTGTDSKFGNRQTLQAGGVVRLQGRKLALDIGMQAGFTSTSLDRNLDAVRERGYGFLFGLAYRFDGTRTEF